MDNTFKNSVIYWAGKPHKHYVLIRNQTRKKMTVPNTPTFKSDIYKPIASNQLVVYSIYSLYNDGDEITSEDIISACFTLFPQKFSLNKYPQWPDSALIGRRLNDCRGNGWITVKIDTGYKLTAKGSRLAEKTAKSLGVAIPRTAKPTLPKKIVGSSFKKAGDVPVKKVFPVSVPGSRKNQQEQKIEGEQGRKAEDRNVQKADSGNNTAPVIPATKIRSVKPSQLPPGKDATPAVITKASEVKQESKDKSDQAVQPYKKVNTAKSKQIQPDKKVRSNSFAKSTKVRHKQNDAVEQKAVPAISDLKTHVGKQKSNGPDKKVPSIIVIKARKVRNEKKSKVEQKVPPTVLVIKTHPERNAQVKKAPPVPGFKSTKVKPGHNENIIAPDAGTKAHPVKQKRGGAINRAFPAPVIETSKVKQDKYEKDAPPAISTKVHPANQKRTAPSKKVLSVPIAETPKVKQEIEIKPAMAITGVSQEAKVRAGKFVRMMETSDAYIQYKKHGPNAGINEFDFRSLLLCTMESSPETLARNVELFKGYADLQNRPDLISFLVYCADKFSHIFAPQKKAIRKIK
jgi:hypothetical protein